MTDRLNSSWASGVKSEKSRRAALIHLTGRRSWDDVVIFDNVGQYPIPGTQTSSGVSVERCPDNGPELAGFWLVLPANVVSERHRVEVQHEAGLAGADRPRAGILPPP